MAIPVIDSTANAKTVDGTGSNSLTWSHVCAGADRVLLVDVTVGNAASQTVLSVTYNGVALGFVDFQNNGTVTRQELWRLIAPPVGTFNVVVTLAAAATARMVGGSTSFTGADQTNPLGTPVKHSGSNTTISNSVASATDEIVVSFPAVSGGTGTSLTNDAAQTQMWNAAANTGTSVPILRGGGARKTGAASVTMTWTCGTSQTWAHLMVAVKPVGGGVTTNNKDNFFLAITDI